MVRRLIHRFVRARDRLAFKLSLATECASCRRHDVSREELTKAIDMARRFQDRTDAGRLLAKKLSQYADRKDVIIMVMPRGGVPVAFESRSRCGFRWTSLLCASLAYLVTENWRWAPSRLAVFASSTKR